MVAHPQTPPAPRELRILLATPLIGGQLHDDVAHALIATALEDVPGIVFEWRRYKGAGLTVARNELVRQMYELRCQAIIFIDSDNPFEPRQLFGLIRHGVDIVGGLYPHKSADGVNTWVCNFIEGETPNPNGLLKVRNVGAGCLFISRRALDIVAMSFPDHAYTRGNPDGTNTKLFNYFGTAVVHGELLTEDFYLSHLAALCGIDSHVDVNVRLDHVGAKRWSAMAPELPRPWEKASEQEQADA